MSKNTQDKTIESPLAMVRVSMHSRTRSDRNTIAERLLQAGLGILNIAHGQKATERKGILYERNTADAIRQGLAHQLKGKLKGFSADGKSFKILQTNQKGLPVGDLGIILDLQEAGKDTEYPKIGLLSYSPENGASVGFSPGPGFEKLPEEMQKILQDPGDLIRIGKESLFDADLRKIVEYLLLGGKFRYLWTGCYLASDQEQIDKAREIREVLSETLEGKFTMSVLQLQSDGVNRASLGEEIESEYTDRLEKILVSLDGATKGNVKRISGEVEELVSSVAALEESLGYTFGDPYWEALSSVTTIINAAKLEWQAEDVAKGAGSGKTKADMAKELEDLRKQLEEMKESQAKETEEKKQAAKASGKKPAKK